MDNNIQLYHTPIPTTEHKIINREILHCAICNKKLVELITTQTTTNRENKYIVKCTCGEQSFVKKIIGFASVAPCDNLTITNVFTQNDLTTIEVK